MASDTVVNFLAALLLLGAAVFLGALLAKERREAFRSGAALLASVLAVGATAASLYFSEIAGYLPCELCWYQWIAMYPLAILTVGAAVRDGRSLSPYIQMIAVLGFAIAVYHVQLQAFPDQQSFCGLTNPCTESPTKAFGAITIPQMSALSFAGIAALTTLARTSQTETSCPNGQQAPNPTST